MNISVLNNSVRISVDIKADEAVNAIATNTAMVAYKAVKFTLDRAVADTLKVYSEVSKVAAVVTDKVQADCSTVINAGRSSGVATEKAISTTYSKVKAQVIVGADEAIETRDAIITATKIKLESLINKEVINPTQTKTAEVVAPIKARIAKVEEAIANYTQIEEVHAIAENIQPENDSTAFSEEWGHKAVEAAKQGHVLVGDRVITENGVTNATWTEAAEEVKPKASNLSEMIREEVAKQ